MTYPHTGLANDTQYSYRVCAYDALNNISTGITATCTPGAAIYTISSSFTGSGAMTCTPESVSPGGSFECTISPESGFHLESLLDDTADVTAQVSGTKYTITNVTADHTLQATFQQNFVLRLWGTNSETWYTLIQGSFDAATNGDDILSLNSDFAENLNFDQDIAILLQGGWGPDFDFVTGFTTINGNLTISNGTVIIENLIIK